jgi:hypothetical protein
MPACAVVLPTVGLLRLLLGAYFVRPNLSLNPDTSPAALARRPLGVG